MGPLDAFDVFADGFSYTWKYHLFQGMLFILFGLLILFFPELLLFMVSSIFILIGVLFMASAWSLRRYQKLYNGIRLNPADDS